MNRTQPHVSNPLYQCVFGHSFILIHLCCSQAEELSARSPSSPLICPSDLDAFPACMDDAVAAAFHRHFGTFNRLQRSNALLLIHTLLSAREPLTPGQIQLALGEDMAQLGFGPGVGSAPGRPVRDYLAAMLPGWGTLVVEREGHIVFAQVRETTCVACLGNQPNDHGMLQHKLSVSCMTVMHKTSKLFAIACLCHARNIKTVCNRMSVSPLDVRVGL